VRPAASSIGVLSRAAFISAQIVFAVPTLTCTMTAAGSPATFQYPCAIAVATFSCGTVTNCGAGSPRFCICTRPSMIGAKSVPPFANTYFTPLACSAAM
jgi:hypothetical protein